jgi:hypothetical protein
MIVATVLAGCVLAYLVSMGIDWVEERYEARTGLDWTTGEPK